jgi:hypothetical protein
MSAPALRIIARARASWRRETLRRTFSRRLMCAAISANTPGIGRKLPGQVSRLWGQDSHTASCLSHSAGIRKPSAAGVWVAARICG